MKHLLVLTVLPLWAASLALSQDVTPSRVQRRDPASTCTPTVMARRGYVCGVRGTLANSSVIDTFTSCDGDYTGCYEQCYSNTQCISFSYDPDTQECKTYSKQVLKQKFKKSTTGPVFYNRRNCFLPPSCEDSVCPPPPEAPPLCGNQGIEWALYQNNQGDPNDDLYSTFDPTYFKTQSPAQTGTTNTVGGFNYPSGDTTSIYGSQPFSVYNFTFNHRGFFYPVVSGTYIVTTHLCDDICLFWGGSEAYSGWTRDNALAIASIRTNYGGTSTTFEMTAGQYYPFRIVYGQAEGGAAFYITVTDPNGEQFADSSMADSPNMVRYSCDETAQPRFQDFGKET